MNTEKKVLDGRNVPSAVTCSEATLLSNARRSNRRFQSRHAKQSGDIDGAMRSTAREQKSVGCAVPVGRRSSRTAEPVL